MCSIFILVLDFRVRIVVVIIDVIVAADMIVNVIVQAGFWLYSIAVAFSFVGLYFMSEFLLEFYFNIKTSKSNINKKSK